LPGIEAIADLLDYCTEDELKEIDGILATDTPIWVPQSGPQTEAYNSEADILFYGGSAGGGKTDLILGLSLTKHTSSMIYRRQATQLIGIESRLLDEIVRTRRGWNGQKDILSINNCKIEFGSCNNLGDEIKHQGRPHDFIGFDEITHFLESQFRFLIGWLRTTKTGQRCRVVCAGNPPTNAEGAWVKEYWGPWLDPNHPNPAEPGELRWYTTIDGKDVECPNGDPINHNGRMLKPLSRTFIPSRVTDNVFVMSTGYEAMLQALPEPLRSQMLHGDFTAGTEDNAYQTIPSAWVDAAMARWTPDGQKGEMSSVGVDVARGGKDDTIIATRYGNWYAPLKRYPGKDTPDGPIVAGLAISEQKDSAPIHVDVIGVGSSVVDHLRCNDIQVVGLNGAAREGIENARDKSGQLKFRNWRAYLYWTFREALDPKSGKNIALPPDTKLKADLCTPMWKLSLQGIQIESKDEIKDRLGRSPDNGDAVVYCAMDTLKIVRTYLGLAAQKQHEQFNVNDWLRG
jgi:hypothetical protein